MGFGHRVYKTLDPRAVILKRFSKQLAEESDEPHWYDMSEQIEHIVVEEKGLYPNVDFYSASTYHYLGIETGLFTPIFAMSRVVGWAAHVIEQHADNRLIRPSSEYVGPPARPTSPSSAGRSPRSRSGVLWPQAHRVAPAGLEPDSPVGADRGQVARVDVEHDLAQAEPLERVPAHERRRLGALARPAVGGLADQDREARTTECPQLQAGVPDHGALAHLLDAERDQVRVGQRLAAP